MLVLGIDVGTTGTKTLLVDGTGAVLSGAYKEYSLSSGGKGFVTQNADDWWDALVATVRETLKNNTAKISAISLSTQGASMLATDAGGDPLCDVMTWMDSRAAEEVSILKDLLGEGTVYKKCGWPLSPAGDAAKILWLKRNMPDVFNGAACFPSTVEFINKKLTGRFVTDPTNAAIRQLFNIEDKRWDPEILDAIGITEARLPEVVPTGAYVGNLTEKAADELGLTTDVAVFCGAHDQYCASVGAGAILPGDMMLATGTAWVVLGITDKLLYTESRICPGIHPVQGVFGAMASLVSAGSALKWYKELIGGDFKTMDAEASKRAESAKDIFVLPYVAGAGFPHSRPEVGGTVSGFRVGNDKYDLARAFMEGVSFEARGVIEEFSRRGMKIDRLMMTGGAAKSDLWSGITRDVTGCSIYRPAEAETCCLGAAEIAFVGTGAARDYAECRRIMVRSEEFGKVDERMKAFYDEKYEKYKRLRAAFLGV